MLDSAIAREKASLSEQASIEETDGSPGGWRPYSTCPRLPEIIDLCIVEAIAISQSRAFHGELEPMESSEKAVELQ